MPSRGMTRSSFLHQKNTSRIDDALEICSRCISIRLPPPSCWFPNEAGNWKVICVRIHGSRIEWAKITVNLRSQFASSNLERFFLNLTTTQNQERRPNIHLFSLENSSCQPVFTPPLYLSFCLSLCVSFVLSTPTFLPVILSLYLSVCLSVFFF